MPAATGRVALPPDGMHLCGFKCGQTALAGPSIAIVALASHQKGAAFPAKSEELSLSMTLEASTWEGKRALHILFENIKLPGAAPQNPGQQISTFAMRTSVTLRCFPGVFRAPETCPCGRASQYSRIPFSRRWSSNSRTSQRWGPGACA